MSVAFTKKESAETAAETLLPDRPISSHPNLVTEAGLKALTRQLESGSISFVSPVARALIGKAVGDVVGAGNQELEIVAIK
jgi:transcription elongation GreA/GreB family factor